MNILLVNVPSRRGQGAYYLPIGLLYVGGIVERCGHSTRVVDLYSDDIELNVFNSCSLDKIIEEYKPDIIGYGGIATSYGRTKQLSTHIKGKYANIIQIVGGTLASVYKLLLQKAKIDVVFHGEVETSLPIFLKRVMKSRWIKDIRGISYTKNGEVIRNPPIEQIKDIDDIPFPAYHLMDIKKYLINDTYIPILTARGCTNKCSFCYRHNVGVRQNSVEYIINHIKFIMMEYGFHNFHFGDELFNSKYDWLVEFCDRLDSENLIINYIIAGARVSNIDEHILKRMKETGCVEIRYGQESGSDIILKEFRKGVTAQRNRDITNLTRQMGIKCPVQLVIGSPSETTKTIYETIKLLKDTDSYRNYSLNYLIPLPETPIWEYVEKNNLIDDVEEYLDRIVDVGGGASVINLTKQPNFIWHSWDLYIHLEMKSYHYKEMNQVKEYLIYRFVIILIPLITIVSPFVPSKLKVILKGKVK